MSLIQSGMWAESVIDGQEEVLLEKDWNEKTGELQPPSFVCCISAY